MAFGWKSYMLDLVAVVKSIIYGKSKTECHLGTLFKTN